jgi:hypothetical protein
MESFMKKKILILCSALFLICAADVFSFGIGVRGSGDWINGGYGFGNWGAGLLISPTKHKGNKSREIPLHFGINWYVKDGINLGLTADYWLLKPQIKAMGSGGLKFYLGAGAFVDVGVFEKNVDINAGVRVPVGVDFDFNVVDFFVEVVPMLPIYIVPDFHVQFGVGGSVGLRFWLGK